MFGAAIQDQDVPGGGQGRPAPQVQVAQGRLRGAWRGDSAAFLGIPFAQPPVGALRFQAPVPAGGWDGVRDASAYGPTPQRRPFAQVTTIPEPSIPGDDTLSVNVFTPRPAEPDAALPVLVWIHGGGYKAGSPASPWYDGRGFNADGIVVVTIAYRLGFDGFGWIADAPANRGVLDQILALEWVRDNIAAFGGDPGRVTIGGQSAGSGAVLGLLASPRARGLFGAVVAHSGGYLALDPGHARTLGERLAVLAGVEPTCAGWATVSEDRILDLQDALEAELNPPALTRGDVASAVLPLSTEPTFGIPFLPVADPGLLPASFEETAAQGAAVPLFLGATAHEFTPIGALFAQVLGEEDPVAFLAEAGLGDFAAEYAAAHPELPGSLLLGQPVTDRTFRTAVPRIVAARGAAPTWVWDFREPGASGLAEHCGDLPFVFDCLNAPLVEAALGPNPSRELATGMHADWVEFITTGALPWPRAGEELVTRTYARDGIGVAPGYQIERRLSEVLAARANEQLEGVRA